jgi:hypothetical protein
MEAVMSFAKWQILSSSLFGGLDGSWSHICSGEEMNRGLLIAVIEYSVRLMKRESVCSVRAPPQI